MMIEHATTRATLVARTLRSDLANHSRRMGELADRKAAALKVKDPYQRRAALVEIDVEAERLRMSADTLRRVARRTLG
ncbi:MAG: hypothetical protein AAGJ46_06620 [Planctomycetota bacterium]